MSETLSVRFVDEDGDVAVHRYKLTEGLVDPGDALIEAFLQATHAISHAAIPKFGLLADEEVTDVKDTGPYDAEDKMVMYFRSNAGNLVKIPIPAPDREDMDANDEEFTILALSDPDDLVTEILLYLVDKGASALKDFIKSKRSRKNRK